MYMNDFPKITKNSPFIVNYKARHDEYQQQYDNLEFKADIRDFPRGKILIESYSKFRNLKAKLQENRKFKLAI